MPHYITLHSPNSPFTKKLLTASSSVARGAGANTSGAMDDRRQNGVRIFSSLPFSGVIRGAILSYGCNIELGHNIRNK